MNFNSSQFRCETDDILSFSLQETASMAALIAYLLAVESEHPGTLAWVVRQVALADNNWRLTTRSSDPSKSLIAQHEAVGWMKQRDEALRKARQEGAMHHAENESGRRNWPGI